MRDYFDQTVADTYDRAFEEGKIEEKKELLIELVKKNIISKETLTALHFDGVKFIE